ncbi:(d)CMP kinase [Acetobacteraceae bacterium]|nr:(d)CMP kinase [Candidatus Parcubacteria bacterium]
MVGIFVALTGPAKCGKDTLASLLQKRITETGAGASCISGTAVFRSVALWVYERGNSPELPLPADTFEGVVLSLEHSRVGIVRGLARTTYAEDEYQKPEVASLGSRFAATSPAYKRFIFAAVSQHVRTLSRSGTHAILGARDSLKIAAGLPDVPSLAVNLSVSKEVQRQRLVEHFQSRGRPEHYVDQLVQDELERDNRDRESGTLPPEEGAMLDTETRSRSGVLYRLRNDTTPEEAVRRLFCAFCSLG